MGDAASISRSALAEMAAYYRARAPEYDLWYRRQGSYDLGAEGNARWTAQLEEVTAALDRFAIQGDALELAGGTGFWTQRLARTARTVTVVDASPEMLAINRAHLASDRIRYLVADLFTWVPDRLYDAICLAFWLSHVPHDRLDGFLRMVAGAVRPGGKLFIVDSRWSPASTATENGGSQLQLRRLEDGREFHVVKNYLAPAGLAPHLDAAGFDVDIRETAEASGKPAFFTYALGTRRPDKTSSPPRRET